MSPIDAVLGILCAAGGVALLHRAWTRRGGAGLVLRGWLLMALGVAPWRASGSAWDKAVAFTVLTPMLLAACALIWEVEWKPGRVKTRPAREIAPAELPGASGPLWRGLARTILAGPVAGFAGLALAVLAALRAPFGEADRLVAAGFILPLAWAVAGVWATTDARLGRVAAGLLVIVLAGFGAVRL